MAIRQPEEGYRTAIDPVLLAAAIEAGPSERVLDVGCGTGAASLCLATRIPGARITGIDSMVEFIELARESVALNKLESPPEFEVVDLKDYLSVDPFDHVITNPPYWAKDTGNSSPDPLKRAATVESTMTLAEWIDTCFQLLRPGGLFTMIHSRERLKEVRSLIAPLAAAAVIHPIWPNRRRKRSKRFLIQAVTADAQSSTISRGGVHMADGLVLHQANGTYTDEADQILYSGAGFGLKFP